MVCRDEGFGGANTRIVNLNLRLERIAAWWVDYCSKKSSKGTVKSNHDFDAVSIRPEARRAFEKKCRIWTQQVYAVYEDVKTLMEKLDNSERITPADWDAVVAGRERKVFALVASRHPRETWPRGVPYPNMVARGLYMRAEWHRRAQYVKVYSGVVRDIANRGAWINKFKQITGDTTDALGPVTVRSLRQRLEQSRTEMRSKVNWSRLEQEVYQHVVTSLQGERVLSRHWDAYAWAGDLLMTLGLADSDEAKDRVVRMAEEVVERWHLDNGHDAGSDDGMEVDSEQASDSTHTYSSYQYSDADDDRESLLDDDLETDLDLHYEGEYFLPYDV